MRKAAFALTVLLSGCAFPQASDFGSEGTRLAGMGAMMPLPADLGDGWELVPARLMAGLPGLAAYGMQGNPDFVAPPATSAGSPLQVAVAAHALAADPGGEGVLVLVFRLGDADLAEPWAASVPCEGRQLVAGDLVARLAVVSLDGRAIEHALAEAAVERAATAIANRTAARDVPCPGMEAGWISWGGPATAPLTSPSSAPWSPGPTASPPPSWTSSPRSSEPVPAPARPAPPPCPAGSDERVFRDVHAPDGLAAFSVQLPEAYAGDPRASSPGMLYLESGRQAVALPGPVMADGDAAFLSTGPVFGRFDDRPEGWEGLVVGLNGTARLKLAISDFEDEVALPEIHLARCDGEVRSTLYLAGVGSGITWQMQAWFEGDGWQAKAVDLPVVEVR